MRLRLRRASWGRGHHGSRAAAWLLGAVLIAAALAARAADWAVPSHWPTEFPKADFSRHAVSLDEIAEVLTRDAIPAVDEPRFVPAGEVRDVGGNEPVVSVVIAGEARAYPLRVLIWHEIVNDTVGGVPVAVTYCPLCNSAVVFDRRVGPDVLDFGTTGRLRLSDLIMYDRQSESWWQQFLGEAIVGTRTGERLTMLPARVESLERFRERAPGGLVLVPTSPAMRLYGLNPYPSYDSRKRPFKFFTGPLPEGIAPLAHVVAVEGEAWSLDLLRARGRITKGDLVLTWGPGQASALDSQLMAEGRDIGNVVVQRQTASGLEDVIYDVSFAFAFHAFHPTGVIHKE
ncbi:MAG: DUF3179 domain-containing protein [Alphaproteobacteria bacterium]